MEEGALAVVGGQVIATDVRRVTSPLRRMMGLLGSPRITTGQALIISSAAQVHSFGMRYPIDVIFCDRTMRVLHVVWGLRPFRITKWVRGARHAIELTEGGAASVRIGDVLEISPR